MNIIDSCYRHSMDSILDSKFPLLQISLEKSSLTSQFVTTKPRPLGAQNFRIKTNQSTSGKVS